MLVGGKILFRQRETVLVLLDEPESDDLACMMLNIKMDIECFISNYRFTSTATTTTLKIYCFQSVGVSCDTNVLESKRYFTNVDSILCSCYRTILFTT